MPELLTKEDQIKFEKQIDVFAAQLHAQIMESETRLEARIEKLEKTAINHSGQLRQLITGLTRKAKRLFNPNSVTIESENV